MTRKKIIVTTFILIILFLLCQLFSNKPHSVHTSTSPLKTSPVEAPVVPSTFNGHTYLLFDQYKTWNAAKTFCESLGGHLVTISSKEEQAYIDKNVLNEGSKTYYWIGGNQPSGCLEPTSGWSWINEDAFTYTNWHHTQPDNHYNSDKMGIVKDIDWTGVLNTGKWHDDTNWGVFSKALYGFICEWDYVNTNMLMGNTIITTPLDGRPISGEYLKNLVSFGGDNYVSAGDSDTMPNAFLDQGFKNPGDKEITTGDSVGIRNNLYEIVKKHNNTNTTVIINTSSYITKGMIGCRIPYNYENYDQALIDMDNLIDTCNNPRYYIHALMPRTQPESRAFNWGEDKKIDGMEHYYNKKYNPDNSKSYEISFSQGLLEWGYVRNKLNETGIISDWEMEFLNIFENQFINSQPHKLPQNLKYKNKPLPFVYKDLFYKAAQVMKSLIDRVYTGKIDDLVLSAEDFEVPEFVWKNKDAPWVKKDFYNNPVKYSWSRTYLITDPDSVMNYHKAYFGTAELEKAQKGSGKKINYIFGADEIPQMIYARDLTKRKGIATKFSKPVFDFSENNVNGKWVNKSMLENWVGRYDVVSVGEIITQRLNYVTTKESPDTYQKGVTCPQAQKTFDLFIHNSDWISPQDIKLRLDGKITDPLYGYNLLDSKKASVFASKIYQSYNNGNNTGLIDLKTNSVDWELFNSLSSDTKNSITQLSCYSGWNTIGNSAGLGIAHGQVFGIFDYLGGPLNKLDEKVKFHSQILAQHLLEDSLYNTKIKAVYKNSKSDVVGLKESLSNILKSESFNLENYRNTPGGDYWVMRHFKNPSIKMRFSNMFYSYNSADVTFATLPWNRNFECILKTDFGLIER